METNAKKPRLNADKLVAALSKLPQAQAPAPQQRTLANQNPHIEVKGQYIYITYKRGEDIYNYQIKVEDEGLIIDGVDAQDQLFEIMGIEHTNVPE